MRACGPEPGDAGGRELAAVVRSSTWEKDSVILESNMAVKVITPRFSVCRESRGGVDNGIVVLQDRLAVRKSLLYKCSSLFLNNSTLRIYRK